MPRVSLLIADDVGLGKTIEAGLVAQELAIRGRARRMLVVCPAALQIQWRDQMREKFGLEFRIVDSQLMRERHARGIHVNPWSHFPRLITSIDYLKRDQPMRLFRETLPIGEVVYPRAWDLLIVDEAHNVAPSGTGAYAVDSQRTSAIRTMVPHFEHKLFLTATPHNGYNESFTALLEMLDNQRFARGVRPEGDKLQRIMVRRLKSEITTGIGQRPRFPSRVLDAIEVDYSADERAAHRLLHAYTEHAARRDGRGRAHRDRVCACCSRSACCRRRRRFTRRSPSIARRSQPAPHVHAPSAFARATPGYCARCLSASRTRSATDDEYGGDG